METRAFLLLWEVNLDAKLCREEWCDLFNIISWYPVLGMWLSIDV